MRYSIVTLAAVAGAQSVAAWGALGHQTVALVAQNYLTTETKDWVTKILGATMVSVATWADTYRYTDAGSWSAPMHFIDAEDNPPHSCGVELTRDCGEGGCVVAAIANYTQQILATTTTAAEQEIAMKFLIHFFGDVTQPLHCEAIDVGGNTVAVTFDGYSTNLHAAWDTSMPEKIVGMTYTQSTVTYAGKWSKTLIAAINTGIYKSDTKTWTACSDITSAENCALAWAVDSNAFVCSDVLAGGISSLSNAELDNSYYTKAAPIINEQIAKGESEIFRRRLTRGRGLLIGAFIAGYRLGDWLNKMYAASH